MMRWWIIALLMGMGQSLAPAVPSDAPPALWTLGKKSAELHRFSTLFTAQDVRDHLASEAGLAEAVQWCRSSGVTKAYLEEFRDGYQAERSTLARARDRFRAAGLVVSGCVTTSRVGKPADHWGSYISCYTDFATQDRVESLFEYAASLFDEIMIDDFWFSECTCSNCAAARQARIVTIGANAYPVRGGTWADYHCELMLRMSQDRVLAAAKRINPRARMILKYPLWYEQFQDRGYDVMRETAAFDRIWVGTETRDYADREWGGTPQYSGYFLMRWLGGIGGEKCGGGWFDSLGTSAPTYLEQARQTILGGARETMLYCYGGIQHGGDIEALRANMPELLSVAREVQRREPAGLAAYQPPNSNPLEEPHIWDFVGMIGLPLVPQHEFPTKAPAIFLSVHALSDPHLAEELGGFIAARKPVLLTDALARRLTGRVDLAATNVSVLPVGGQPKSLIDWPQARLDDLRAPLLGALQASFRAPNRVALYLFTRGSWVVENFNDAPVEVVLNGQKFKVAARGWRSRWK